MTFTKYGQSGGWVDARRISVRVGSVSYRRLPWPTPSMIRSLTAGGCWRADEINRAPADIAMWRVLSLVTPPGRRISTRNPLADSGGVIRNGVTLRDSRFHCTGNSAYSIRRIGR